MYAADKVTSKLNEMDREGWNFVRGWSVANVNGPPISRYTTTLVFEREPQTGIGKPFEIEMALDWDHITGPEPRDDDILRREMAAAARGSKVPAVDPLLDGGLER
jgi:hypothetical protein